MIGDLVDLYLLYASAALAVMGIVALALSFVFHQRLRRLNAVSGYSVATVFSRTFMVFEPFQKTTVFHRFLSFMPFIPIIGGFGIAILLFVIIDAGLLLTLLLVIVAMSLITLEESVEAYAESKLLIKALQNGTSLGVGDVKLLHVTRRILPRLTRYYVGLAAFLFISAAVLPLVWTDVLMYFAMFFGYLIQAGAMAGPAGWAATMIVYALSIVAFMVLVVLAKNRIFGHRVESGPL